MTKDSRREALGGLTPLRAVKGIGPKREELLGAQGFRTVVDLLGHVPRRYEDRRSISQLSEVAAGREFTLVGQIEELKTIRLYRRRMTMVRGVVVGDGCRLPVTWFNRPYLAKQVSADASYLLHGAVRERGGGLELVNPSLEKREEARLGARLVPVYSPIGELGPALVRRTIDAVLDRLAPDSIVDPVPRHLLDSHQLPSLEDAVRALHRPNEGVNVESLNERETPAHHRLVYGELLRHQSELALVRSRNQALRKQHSYAAVAEVRRAVSDSLPFSLTAAQDRSLDEIVGDLSDAAPMARLLQGDVGSGKTVVAAVGLAIAAENGLQSAIMAPTELLAEQHFESLCSLLGDRFRIELVTASTMSEELRTKLRSGEAQIAVGTHALFQRSLDFERLALAVVDEQHRFGVAQRQELLAKGLHPDLLVMTATPIPRSLALTLYGDLALSAIDELPPGRKPVETRLEPNSRREKVYGWLTSELERGHKAFVVLPLIEESDRVAAEAVEGLGLELAASLSRFRPVVLHGRIDSEERSKIMAEFSSGAAQVLIATSLVEVGVDVPEATVMMIESAERFGLAQLHQLRGRVGRGAERSTCVAVHGALTETGRARLDTFQTIRDGFALAEADLEIRGPGDLLGTRQAGFPNVRLSDLVRHRQWIEKARADARRLVEERAAGSSAFLSAVAERVGDNSPLAGA